MIIKRKDNNIFIKELDNLELANKNKIDRFLNSEEHMDKATAESIILESVKRTKREIEKTLKYLNDYKDNLVKPPSSSDQIQNADDLKRYIKILEDNLAKTNDRIDFIESHNFIVE